MPDFFPEIFIRFHGSASSSWWEWETHHHHRGISIVSYSSHPHGTNRWYRGNKTYFDIMTPILGDGRNSVQIPTGENVYPFSIRIPNMLLPPACTLNYGQVSYILQGRIVKPWYRSDNTTHSHSIIIFPSVDLNVKTVTDPLTLEDTKQIGCCWWPSGPCKITTKTLKSGYAIGDTFPFSVEIRNKSRETISQVTATLTQNWTLMGDEAYRISTYNTHTHLKTETYDLDKAGYYEIIKPGEVVKWEGFSLTIPPTVPPTPPSIVSDFIKLEYLVIVRNYCTDL